MRTYQVWMKGTDKCIELQAANVSLEYDAEAIEVAYWRFDNGNNVTVAAFPFRLVEYIVAVLSGANEG